MQVASHGFGNWSSTLQSLTPNHNALTAHSDRRGESWVYIGASVALFAKQRRKFRQLDSRNELQRIPESQEKDNPQSEWIRSS